MSEGGRFGALRHRHFRLLWSGLIVSNVGTWMQNVGQSWLILQLTNSPLWLGLLGLSFAVPMTVGPLLSGVVVDRVDRVRLLCVTQTGMMAVAAILAALTQSGHAGVWVILASSFLGSSLLAFDNPARHSLIPALVPPRDLLNALSLGSAVYNGAALVGPAIAGVLLGRFHPALLFWLNALSYLAVLGALAGLRRVPGRSGGGATSFRSLLVSGFSYAGRTSTVRTLLLLSAVAAVFGRSYQSLLPVFSRDIWRGGPEGYGLLLGAGGAGALVGAFGLAALGEVRRQGRTLLTSGLLFTVCLIAFAWGPSLPFGVGMLFLAGITSTVFTTIAATFIQLTTPNEFRGRMMSLYAITLVGLPALGALGATSLAEWFGGVHGAPRAVVAGAVILGGVLLLSTPSVRRAEGALAKREEDPPGGARPLG